jgi:hypothetical protein
MSVYLTPVLSGDLCEFLGKPNGARWLTGDSNAEAKQVAKAVGSPANESYRFRDGARARLDHFALDLEQAAKAIEAGAIEETFEEYRRRVDRRAELLEENGRDSER